MGSVEQRGTEATEAISDLFRAQRRPMARLAYVLTRDAEVSDEIVQDAFLRLHARWDAIDNPVAYLRTTVINGCHSHHRHLRVVRSAPGDVTVHGALGADELSDALDQLPYEQRAVLALRYFCDFDDVEIARILGIRRATVRTRAHRALAHLRKEIEP